MQCGHFPQALICFGPDRAFTMDHTKRIGKPSPNWICLNKIACSWQTLRNGRSTVINALISLDHNRITADTSAMCVVIKICAYIQDFSQDLTFNSPRDDRESREPGLFGSPKVDPTFQCSIVLSTMLGTKSRHSRD
jgi:hypothetical protein